MSQPRPTVSAELIWSDGLRLGATSGETALVIDGDSIAGPSPVQLLVMSLAACMGIDVLDILVKGRHGLTGFRTSITAERPPDPPRRLLSATLMFHIHGAVPQPAVERAISLSRDKYCSVWHSLRQDIVLTTSFEILA